MSMSLFWLVAMVLFGVLEAVTVGLTSIWFALGALGALAAAAASAPVIVQIVVFLGVSFLTLLLVRPLAQHYVNDRKVATNADRVIGREAVVTEDIDNIQGKGWSPSPAPTGPHGLRTIGPFPRAARSGYSASKASRSSSPLPAPPASPSPRPDPGRGT